MIKRALGSTGLQVSALGLGCNNFGSRLDPERTRLVVDAAIAAGINFIDTADAYGNRGGSERLLGETLGNRRKNVVLATKFGLPMDETGRLKGASRAYVMTAVEESLKRLKTEWIDLYYLHRPDPATPIEETLRAFEDLIQQGKVRFAGCSNLSGSQLADSIEIARAQELEPFAAAQDEYNLLSRGIETAGPLSHPESLESADHLGKLAASILARRPISRAIDPATKDCNGGGLLFEPSAFGM
jgi:aryl-alcohol dehydrogenase-like predicted oxidoreductase